MKMPEVRITLILKIYIDQVTLTLLMIKNMEQEIIKVEEDPLLEKQRQG